MTSASCALASNLAGEIAAIYPDLWAESLRALIVHSARWSDTMLRQFNVVGRTNIKSFYVLVVMVFQIENVRYIVQKMDLLIYRKIP